MALEEDASPAATVGGDSEMEFTLDDCRRALSGIVHEEKLLEKKRRWLMTSPTGTRKAHKRLRTPGCFRNLYLPESFIRNDDVVLQDMRLLVQRGFRLSAENKRFDGTAYPKIEEVIEESSPESLAQSESGDHFERVNMMPETLSYFTSLDPTSSYLVSFIDKILEGLEALPSLALLAMNRKLKDVAVTPQFPVIFSCKRNILVDRLRKKCHKILSTHMKQGQLPKLLAKALAVMFLSVKQITRQADIATPKVFPYTPEIENLQNEILKAIWSLPNVKHGELKHLQHVIDPNANLPSKSLRKALHNYLMEYLFQCDDVHVTKQFLMVLKLINEGSGCQLHGEVSEEVEAILNVSSQLRQVVWDSLPNKSIDEEFANAYAECLGTIEDDCDIIIDENEDCSTFGYSDYLQVCESDDDVEGTGDSTTGVSYRSFNSKDGSSSQPIDGQQLTGNLKETRRNQNGSSAELSLLQTDTNTNRYLELQNICDETSLVAYRVIGHLLEELVQTEGKRLEEATELYLKVGASSTPNHQDPGNANVLSENLESAVLQVIRERMTSFSNIGIERVKEFLRLL